MRVKLRKNEHLIANFYGEADDVEIVMFFDSDKDNYHVRYVGYAEEVGLGVVNTDFKTIEEAVERFNELVKEELQTAIDYFEA